MSCKFIKTKGLTGEALETAVAIRRKLRHYRTEARAAKRTSWASRGNPRTKTFEVMRVNGVEAVTMRVGGPGDATGAQRAKYVREMDHLRAIGAR